MTVNLIDYITSLAERAGVTPDAEELKPILTNPALASIEVPKSLITATDSHLFTEEEARINPNLKKYFSAMALNVADKNLRTLAAQYLDGDDIAEINKEELKTADIARIMLEKVKAKHAATDNKDDKKTYLAEITKLQGIIAEKESAAATAVAERDNYWRTTLANKELETMFVGYDYAMDVPKEISVATARNLYDAKLKELNGKYVYDEVNGGRLVVADSPELPLSINNKQVTPKQLADMVVEPIQKKHNANPNPTSVPTPSNPNTKTGGNPAAASIARENAKALEGSVAVM